MYFIVDRIEEGKAVCENSQTGTQVIFALSDMPLGIKEGDVVEDGHINHERTAALKSNLKARFDRLKKRS